MMKTLLCCLGMFVLLTQNQAFASKVGHCRYDMESPTTATEELKDYKPRAFKVLITFTVQYQHAGDDESIARSKTYSKEYAKSLIIRVSTYGVQQHEKIIYTSCDDDMRRSCPASTVIRK